MKTLPNTHPGEILLEAFLNPMGISQNRLARAMDVPPRRINEIVRGNVPSQQIPLSGLPVPWAPLNSSGWDCRLTTTWNFTI